MHNKLVKIFSTFSSFLNNRRKMTILISSLAVLAVIIIIIGVSIHYSKPKQEIVSMGELLEENYNEYVRNAIEKGQDPMGYFEYLRYMREGLDPLNPIDPRDREPTYGEFKCLHPFHSSLDSIYVRTQDGNISCISGHPGYFSTECTSLTNNACNRNILNKESTNMSLITCRSDNKEDPNHWCSKADEYFDQPIENAPKWSCFPDRNGNYQPGAYIENTVVLPRVNTGASSPTEARCNMYIENALSAYSFPAIPINNVSCENTVSYKEQCDDAKAHFDK